MDHHEVIAFARALVETDRLGSCQHRVIDYFCEPQRWTHAYRIWCKMGRPDGPGHPRFDELMKRYLAEGKARVFPGSPPDRDVRFKAPRA
jgi:hypothetical protein